MSTIKTVWNFINGKKTHIIAAAMLLYGLIVVGWGQNDWNTAADIILNALGLSALRHAVSK